MRVINKVLRKRKITVNTRDNINTFSLLSSFTNAIVLRTQARNIYVPGLLTKHYVVWAEFPMDLFHFLQWKMFFPIH